MTANRPKHSGCDTLAVGVAVPRMMMTGPIFQAVTLTSMSMSFLSRPARPAVLLAAPYALQRVAADPVVIVGKGAALVDDRA